MEEVSGEVDTDSNGNGHHNGQPDVPFGDKPHEVFNLDLMTRFVQQLYAAHRQWFGQVLLETIGAERKTGR